MKPAIWTIFAVLVAGVIALVSVRDPDQVNRQATYRAFADSLVARDYQRAFRLLDDEMASVFVDAEGLEAYVAARDFFPVDYSIGPLSSRVQTVRFTMEDGTRREARLWVQGFGPRVAFFEIPD